MKNRYEELTVLARKILTAAGWTTAEIASACECLTSVWSDIQDPRWNWVRMKYDQPGHDYVPVGVDGIRWEHLCQMVRNNCRVAMAMNIVALDFWRSDNGKGGGNEN